MFRLSVVRNKAGRFAQILLATVFFTGCTLPESSQGPVADIRNGATHSSDFYLQQIQQSTDDNKFGWQMLAIQALLNEGKTEQAGKLLTRLPRERSAEQRQEITLLLAQYRLLTHHLRDARAMLRQISPDALSQNQLARYYRLVIAADKNTPSPALLHAYINQEPQLSSIDEKQKNIDATWLVLIHLNDKQVQNLAMNGNENVLQGWLDLFDVWRFNSHDPATFGNAISDWQAHYSYHPAARMLPSALSDAQLAQPEAGRKIALLLPLSGSAKIFSDAIERGFNDARIGHLAFSASQARFANRTSSRENTPEYASPPTSSDSDPVTAADSADFAETDADDQNSPETSPVASSLQPIDFATASVDIQRYDTTNQQAEQLVIQAQEEGATLIVGPLLKENVEDVANSRTSVNILALNEPANIQNLPNMCYFALSPEDEARDAAQHMRNQGKQRPLLLLPNNELGDRVGKAFTRKWQAIGGGSVLQQRVGSLDELRQKINSKTGIKMSGMPVEDEQSWQDETIADLSTTPIDNATLKNRQPDSVYIVATAAELQLIKPMIAMSTGSRDNIALYASSRSNQAGRGTDFRFEMEGLQFNDIPLLSGANPALLAQASEYFNNDYSQIRLYAMGVDAWMLANHFSEMRYHRGFRINGNTGALKVSPDCVVDRKLRWNQYRHGKVVPVRQ